VAGAVERFRLAAEARGLHLDIRTFPAGTKTAEAAARAVECDVAQIVKSLVFVADGLPLLALTSGANRADIERLATLAGASAVRRATPEEAREATGFGIGGTPPFGHPRPLRTFMDTDLMAYERLWAAAGGPDAVFPISPGELLRASSAQVEEFKARS
jgi:prolyl-tRNA editing enzyme YbaK/EbsC (Cys-tRNA(Pro) deacylase)